MTIGRCPMVQAARDMNAIPTDRWIFPAALRRHALPALLALGGLAAPAALAEAPSLRDTLARGLVAEEVNRDLEAARRDYEAVLASFADQRAVAASALFRLAEIHRTQGRKDEATAQYQRLLREFPEIQNIKLRISKPNAFSDCAAVGIAIERSRQA